MTDQILLGVVAILVLGIMAQWLSWKLHISTVILFIVFGVTAGPITGIIQPDLIFGDLLMPLVSLSVGIILFEGGLTLNIRELRTIGITVNLLISLGMLITWAVTSIAAYYILNFEIKLALLIGALLVVTGPTVIIPLLRQMRLVGKTGSILRWEGILIDPVGALLALLVFQAAFAGDLNSGMSEVGLTFFRSILIGSSLGFLGAYLLAIMLQKRMIPEHLQNAFTMMIVVIVFFASNVLQSESGLFAVTIMGIALANQQKVPVKKIIEFNESIGLLVLSSIFILLTARLSIQDLTSLGIREFLFLLVMIFVTRPLSVFASTIKGGLKFQERILLSFIAPRGVVAVAVSSVFAMRLSIDYPEQAAQIVPIIFFVVIGTVLFYSITAQPLARYLKLTQPDPQGILILGAHKWSRAIAYTLKENDFQVVLVDTNQIDVRKAREKGLTAHRINVLSSDIETRIDMSSLGKLLAITSNDEINSLATLNFSDLIGNANTYQLPLRAKYEMPIYLRGRALFNEKANFDYLQNEFDNGAEIKNVVLKKGLDIREFNKQYLEKITPLFYQDENKKLNMITNDNQPMLKPGTKLFMLTQKDLAEIPEFSPELPI